MDNAERQARWEPGGKIVGSAKGTPYAMIIAHHLILTGYGHWLPNDPRGSMSRGTYTDELVRLAETHFGRRPVQPSRRELREFHREAQRHLAHPVLWFEDADRRALVRAFGGIVNGEGLTCYACSVLSDHAHLLIRKHRLRAEEMLDRFKKAGRDALRGVAPFPAEHPVFSAGASHIFKSDPQAVRNCIVYINDQCRKHHLTPIPCDFICPYDDWPFHRRTTRCP